MNPAELGCAALPNSENPALDPGDRPFLLREPLYNEYDFVAAIAVASLLALLALVTLVLKNVVEWRASRRMARR